MKMVKSLLLGSAAGLVAVAGAQAADLPVKAKPVEYVKICPQYGAGFWYVPGTNTCIKIGSYVRYQWEWDASGGQIYRSGANARFTRTDTPDLEHRIRGVISVDTRTATEWGQLRGFVRVGAEQTHPTTPAEGVFMDRAFIQFGGFTVGRAESFFDLVSLARYNYLNNYFHGNMGATGQGVFAYTFQFGGGFSASLSAEDGGADAAGAAGVNSRTRGKFTLDLDTAGAFTNQGAVATDNGSYAMPDLVGNVRVDQSWGSAMIKAALHQNRGGYYTSFPTGAGVSCTVAAGTSNTTQCGHPDDKMGYALGAGVAFNIPGLPGDSISVEGAWAKGAIGYTVRAGSWRMWGDGRSLGIGLGEDSVFRNGTDLELTESWSIIAAGEHRWTPEWRTSIYGGYAAINYTERQKDMICGRNGFTPVAITGLAIANCDPDNNFWVIGTRTQWNPHPFLDIGLDVSYHRHNTAFAGAGVTTLDGARAAGTVIIEDQDFWTAMFRVQYNMLP
jgi:porin-like protein